MALTPGTRLGAYEITAQIGVGGMGEVYRATDTKLRREVAIKVIPAELASDAERLARFQREAEVLASLNHPNIAAIYGLEDADGSKALVMELVEGQTLAERIAQGPIPAVEALLVARQVAEALEAAHERGIIHRDLKPANVKVRPDGVVKVLDFGLAKAVEPPGGASSHLSMAPTIATPPATTMQGMILGTPAYMSPEQARGRPVDRRTDVWAFGAMLFEMLTGTKPFPGEDVSQMLARVIERDPDWSLLPPSTPARVVQAIAVCLRKDPKQRVSDLSAVRLALDGAFETPATPGAAPSSTGQRQTARLLAGVGVAALVVGALIGALASRTTRPPSSPDPVQRFVITTPASRPVIATTGLNQVAISSDGARIAYGSAAGTGTRSLEIYVRGVGDLEATLLRGTEGGGTAPFFSPDGQFVGFVDADSNQLKRVPVVGGTPQTIATFDTLPVGMEWAPDDTILFTLANKTPAPLLRVPAGGGEAKPLTTVDEAAGDRAHGGTDVLPGGETALFAISGTNGLRLAVVSLTTGRITDLKLAGTAPTYSPTGHIVYSTSDGTLRAVGFDPGRLALTTSTPVPLVEDVNMRAESASFAVSAQGSLVYISGTTAAPQRTLVWVDRSGREQPVGVPPRPYATPRVSPDGTRAVVGIDGDLWVTELARPGTLQRITTGSARERFPLWSPDGERLLFESNETGGAAILSRVPDGRGDAQPVLAASKKWDLLSPEAWSADGRELLFIYRPTGKTTFNVGRLSMDGSQSWQPLLDSEGTESNVVVSRDGRWIAYEADDTGQVEVYVERFPALGGRQILSTGGGKNPIWSRDGRELFYRRGVGVDGAMMVSTIQTTPTFTMGAGKELFGGDYYYTTVGARSWDVAPDGRFLMMDTVETDEANRAQIILVQNWTEELKRLVPVN